jgi:hypothetical protein
VVGISIFAVGHSFDVSCGKEVSTHMLKLNLLNGELLDIFDVSKVSAIIKAWDNSQGIKSCYKIIIDGQLLTLQSKAEYDVLIKHRQEVLGAP